MAIGRVVILGEAALVITMAMLVSMLAILLEVMTTMDMVEDLAVTRVPMVAMLLEIMTTALEDQVAVLGTEALARTMVMPVPSEPMLPVNMEPGVWEVVLEVSL